MMEGFTLVDFTKQGNVSISKCGITIPVKLMQMFPDRKCNYLENGSMIALQPSKDGAVEISKINKQKACGRIWGVDITRHAAKTLGITLGDSIKLDTWVDEGCLVFAYRKMGSER